MSNESSQNRVVQLGAVVSALQSNSISPEEAIDAFEIAAKHVKDIQVDLDVQITPSGFKSFDHYNLLKKNRSELIILGARPSMGKSALMFQIAANVAEAQNVLIYSLEMDKESIIRRMIAGRTGKAINRLAHHPGEVARARKAIDSLNLFIDDRGGLDINTIRSATLDFARRRPLGLVVVDYLGLVRSRDLGNRNNEIGDVTSGLKAMAKEVNCPVFVGSQLNRECERRGRSHTSGNYGDFRPMLSDLRDSGNIEQDADMILFLSRHEMYEPGERPGEADIRVAKNRNGEVGDFVLKFSGTQTRFWDSSAFEEV